MEKIIDIKNLRVSFHTYAGEVQAVRDVSFYAKKGETLAIVGESGCGKTTCGKTCIGMLDRTSGEVLYQGKDVHQDFISRKKYSQAVRKRMERV